ncbi:MAG: hypothetical protein K940chlam3_00258 [Chlamydiae bacterium]|nr:hypothetical protein [Chlamydiota bacterium]
MDLSTDQNNEEATCVEELDVAMEGEIKDGEMPNKKQSSKPSKKGVFDTFLEDLEGQDTPENKISFILQFMDISISQGGSPSFKNFWEARKLCLSLFKEENLSYVVRTHLWGKYVELSKEAHRLKEVLDEQSAFAAEQIKLAIESLEEDLGKMSEPLKYAPELKFDSCAKFIAEDEGHYIKVQRELALLNAFASRINALRKELIKTDMRIRFKNTFFQRLSLAGDKVFPRRKELIKEISQRFIVDIDQFIEENFSSSHFQQPLYFLRDEIKSLQSMAKVLTLNTQAFNQTRMKLSECWDKIKKVEKERKKDRAKMHASFKENVAQVEPKIQELEAKYAAQELNDAQVKASIKEIQDFMRSIKLGRDDVKKLKERLHKISAQQVSMASAVEKERTERQRKVEEERQAAFAKVFSELELLIKDINGQPMEKVVSERDRLIEEFDQLSLTKWESHDIKQQFKVFEDKLSKMKIDNLSTNEREAYDQLQTLFEECQKRRKDIREQLEDYRKASGSSGLDFEQALKQSELQEHEKGRLADVDAEIAEIEKRIQGLADKI